MPQDQDRQITLEEFEEQRRTYYGLPKGLTESLKTQESGGRHYDQKGGVLTSPKAAKGRLQVLQETANRYGLSADDPFENIEAGFRYLSDLHKQVDKSVTDPGERWAQTLAGYHAGDERLREVNKSGTLPTTSDGKIRTDEYVGSIMKRWQQYDQGRSGDQPAAQMNFDLSKPDTPKPISPDSRTFKQQSRPLTARERKLATDETARQKATPQIARMVEDFEALKREGSLDAARSVAAKIKSQYGRWMEVGDGEGGWPYVKSKVQGWNPVRTAPPVTTPSIEDQRRQAQEEFAQKPMLTQLRERAVDAYARGGGQVSKMARQALGVGVGASEFLAGQPFRVADFPAWREGEEARMRNLEERRLRRPSSFVSDVGEGIIEAVPSAAAAIGGTIATGGGLPAAMAIGGGMGAAGADWRDPKRATVQTLLGATAPVIGGKVGAKVGGAVAQRLASPVGQAAARAGGELAGGGLGNVIGSSAEQLAFEGRIDPREQAKQFIIGGALNAPGAVGAARMPATMPISRVNRGIIEPGAMSPALSPRLPRPTDPAQQALADFGNRLVEIEQMIPAVDRPAAIEQARREFNARRRAVALIPEGKAAEPTITPEPVAEPMAAPKPVAPVPALPPGVRVVRVEQGEQMPQLQRGQRQIPMESESGETVVVIADKSANEAELRPLVEQSLRPQVQSAAQPVTEGRPGVVSSQPPPVQSEQQAPSLVGQTVSVNSQGRPVNGSVIGERYGLLRVRLNNGSVVDVPPTAISDPLQSAPAPPMRQPGARVGTPRPPGMAVSPRNMRGAIIGQPSPLVRGNLLGQPDAPPTQLLPTEPVTEPVYPDAPQTQEMPEIRQRIAAENAPTSELPAVGPQRRTADLPRRAMPPIHQTADAERRTAELPAAPIQRRTAEVPRQPIITQEPTMRIRSGEGAELPRRVSRPLEGQPVETGRRRPILTSSRPGGGRLPRPMEGRMYADFPADRRAMIGEGRRVGEEISAGRGEQGQFGKIAQQMFKSTQEGGQKGFDSFFNDADVKGAVGLSRDAGMNDVRVEMKKQLAQMMGVNAGEVSLTQISPDTWNRWANQKRLSRPARAKMQAAIERYQQGVIDETQKTVEVKTQEPQQPKTKLRNTPAENGRTIQHSKFGQVTEAADQSGVRKGNVRVVDQKGGSHVIQDPRKTGNREASFVKAEPKAKSLAQFVKESGGIKPSVANRGELSYASTKESNRVVIISRRGVPADEMRRRAEEAGYGKWETESEFLSALRDDVEGRKVFSSEREVDYEVEYRKSLSEEDQAEFEAFDKFLNDKDAADAYDKVSGGDVSGESVKRLLQFAQQYGLADDSVEAIINEGRSARERSSESAASKILPNNAPSPKKSASQKQPAKLRSASRPGTIMGSGFGALQGFFERGGKSKTNTPKLFDDGRLDGLTGRERLGRKIGTAQTMAQLLNPKTIGQNLIGNAAFAGAKNAANLAAIPVDKILSVFTKQRQVATPQVGAQIRDFVNGFTDVYHLIRTGDHKALASNRYELSNERVFKGKIGGFFEDVMRISLGGPDRGGYLAAYNDSVQQILAAHAKSKTKFSLQKIHDQAKMEAQQAVFQDSNAISDFVTGLRRVLNKVTPFGEKANFGLGDLIGLKYAKTPANLVARGIEYSPAGFAKALYKAAKVMAGKGQGFDQREASLAFGRAFVGTTFGSGLGATLYALGIITQPEQANRGVAAAERGEGLTGYQVNLSALKRYASGGLLDGNFEAGKKQSGDVLMSYDWLQPAAFSIGMGAAAMKAAKNRKADADTLEDTLTQIDAVTSTLTDQSILRNIRDIEKFGLKATARKAVTDLPASFVPSVLNQARQIIDDRAREISREKGARGMEREALDKVLNKLPGASKRLPERKDVVGRSVPSRLEGAGGAALVPIPGRFGKYNPHPVLTAMQENGVGTTGISRKDGESDGQFRERKALAAGWLDKYGRQLTDSAAFRDAPGEIRKAALEYLTKAISTQSSKGRPSLWLLGAGHILATVKESAREKRQESANSLP